MKRLYRDKDNEMIAGVCSGIAEYLGVDATIIRLVFVLFTFLGGGGLWIYLVLWIIMPEEPVILREVVEVEEKPAVVVKVAEETTEKAEKKAPAKAPVKKPATKAKTSTTTAAKKKAPAEKTTKKTDTEAKTE